MLRRHAGPVVVMALLAGALAAAAPAGASARPPRPGVTTICAEHHYRVVTGAGGRRYVIENGNFGGRPECITNHGLRPNFTVTRSGADSNTARVMAYPFALYGCSWKVCTPRSGLPARVRKVRAATASWSPKARGGGPLERRVRRVVRPPPLGHPRPGQGRRADDLAERPRLPGGPVPGHPGRSPPLVRLPLGHVARRRALELHPGPRGPPGHPRQGPGPAADHPQGRANGPDPAGGGGCSTSSPASRSGAAAAACRPPASPPQ